MLTIAAALSVAATSCGSDTVKPPTFEEQQLADLQAELDAHVEIGLEPDLPRTMSYEQREITEIAQYRRRVADDMGIRARVSMAPLAIAATFFAVDGPVDFMLSVIPLDKLGEAVTVARHAFRLRDRAQHSNKLIKLQRQFESALSERSREFLQLSQALTSDERRALRALHKRTASKNIVHMLMRKHLDHTADVRWIAGQLERGAIDRAFVQRFTFDKDIVEDITDYDANISWRTLQDVVARRPVMPSARASLNRKIAGLMAERAARQMLASPGFAARYLRTAQPIATVTGLRYQRGMPRGTQGSLDIIGSTRDGHMVFVEVKHYASGSWNERWQRVVAQLERHDGGIEEHLSDSRTSRRVAAKVLMVSQRGYDEWDDNKQRSAFLARLQRIHWQLALIPSNRINSFNTLIDSLR